MSRKNCIFVMLTRPIKSCNQTLRHSRNKYIYYRQGTVKVRKYHKDREPNKNIQHGGSSRIIVTKRGERELLK